MRRFGKKETKIFEMLHLTHLGRFHKGDEVGTAIEVRQGDSICLNAAFHTLWSCPNIGSYDTNFGLITLRLDPDKFGRRTNCRPCVTGLSLAMLYLTATKQSSSSA